jgi:NAD(P)-dependent dehydrogenase (short-subunit alcohol dehydrogenase family)
VTGGCRGIGQAIARRFAADDANVVTCCRHEHELTTDGRVLQLRCDVREADQLDALVGAVMERFGRLDVLVNNAGGSPPAPAATVSPRFVAAVVALNLTAVFVASQKANTIMQGQAQGGCIVNVASTAGLEPAPGVAAYAAAKAGVMNLTRTLATEWGPRVRVNGVAPSLVLSTAVAAWVGTPEALRQVEASVPMRRLATPDDVAEVCAFLASPTAAYINGETLVLDGGLRIPHGMTTHSSD